MVNRIRLPSVCLASSGLPAVKKPRLSVVRWVVMCPLVLLSLRATAESVRYDIPHEAGADTVPVEVKYRVLPEADMKDRFARYAANDEELYTNAYCNAEAFAAMRTVVPRFECPDEELTDIYCFRWWTYRKHLRSTPSGWVVTEFLPTVGWAGKHNTISCPLGHQLREGRWLAREDYLDDYIRFMVTEGTVNGPRSYACWPAWGTLERAKVTGNRRLALDLLPRFVANYEAWEKGWETRTKGQLAGFWKGLFHLCGDREGTEIALSAEGARPMVNAALWAEASSIARIAREVGDGPLSERFAQKAARLEKEIKTRLWNRERAFFTAESYDGIQDSVCELHGYAPFYFRMPLGGEYAAAWRPLMSERGFLAPKGLTFPRRDTPGFKVSHNCREHECQWNGPSWPYATSVALTALHSSLQAGDGLPVGAGDFVKLLKQYARQHHLVWEDGRTVPWIDENYDPFDGIWLARSLILEADRTGVRKNRYPERGKDYNHSTFCDLVIAGLCGLVPQEGNEIDVRPLAPAEWDWWCLDGVRYHGKDLTVLFDRDGSRYGKGKGLVVLFE